MPSPLGFLGILMEEMELEHEGWQTGGIRSTQTLDLEDVAFSTAWPLKFLLQEHSI
jgi:hypothetical protein